MTHESDAVGGTLLPRAPRLTSLRQVRRELARVYGEARTGQIPTEEATRLTYVLRNLREVLEAELLEQRVADLEARAAALPSSGAPLRLVRRA